MDHWLLAWLLEANVIVSVTVGKGNALNWLGGGGEGLGLHVKESPIMSGG